MSHSSTRKQAPKAVAEYGDPCLTIEYVIQGKLVTNFYCNSMARFAT